MDKVVVIDDAPDIHILLERCLASERVELSSAYDASEGIARVMATRPDLILLDVRLPDLDGFEVCRQLKQMPETADVPIVFLSSVTDAVDKIRGLDLGAIDYVTKPFDQAELKARVRAALRTRRYQRLLSERAQIDGLTGLWNREHFERRLAEFMSNFYRYNRPFSLMMLEVDGFTDICHTFGWPIGENVLREVGEALTSGSRVSDIACRFSDKQFAVLLSESDGNSGRVLLDRVNGMLEVVEIFHHERRVRMSISGGVFEAGFGAKPLPLQPEDVINGSIDVVASALAAGKKQFAIHTDRAPSS
ncbi:MAG: response regulator [Myxococcota bacterium]|nr:response regulator [Myxococcota bacterium]